jgi:hypothetical protein
MELYRSVFHHNPGDIMYNNKSKKM